MEKIFVGLYHFFQRRRFILFSLLILNFAIFGWLAFKVRYEEDISRILPKDPKIEKLNEIFQNSKLLDKLVVMLSVKDSRKANPDSLVIFADSFTASLEEQLAPYVKNISGRVDDEIASRLFTTVINNLPVYLDDTDYRLIDSLTQPAVISATLEGNIRMLSSPVGLALKQVIAKDPVGISFIALKKLKDLQYDENFELYDNYVITRDHKTILVFLTPEYPPANTGMNSVFLTKMDSVIDVSLDVFPGYDASYFGATAVSVGNSVQLRKDTVVTQGAIIVFLLLLLAIFFRKISAPILILLPVVFGALSALAVVYLFKGSISVIALGTGAVVLGIAVNYSLHVYNHFKHTRDMREVLQDLATPLTIGSFTTIGGFLCLQFVKSEMLKDLGLFAACSLIGASVCSLVFLPHLIGKPVVSTNLRVRQNWFEKVSAFQYRPGKWAILFILLLTVILAYKAPGVKFEADLGGLNYMSAKLKDAEKQLNKINDYALKSIYLVVEGKTFDEALSRNEKILQEVKQLKKENTIGKSSGISTLLLSDSLQRDRIAQWSNYWNANRVEMLLKNLEQSGQKLGFRSDAFLSFAQLLNTTYTPAAATELISEYNGFLDEYVNTTKSKTSIITMMKVRPESSGAVYKAFDGRPNVTVIDRQYLTTKFVELINKDFTSIAWMTSLLVFSVLLIMYGRIELTLVSFIPMLLSWIWILGFMNIFDIRFNIINIIVSALIFGLGDDYSLFIMDGLLKQYKTGKKNLESYKSSIFLSAVTTLAGLGVLVFAGHPALRSIALISIIGILCVVLMSQILIPVLFRALITDRVRKGRFPWTASSILLSLFAFSYFLIGCILLLFIGIIFRLSPFGKKAASIGYHKILSSFAKSLMYIMVNVKKEIINPGNERFEKPAVIICNHQSFLDILSMLMLTPKLIMFTNDWVYNSPFFGAVVRMADFYPANQGVEFSTEFLEEKVKQGYSIMIFPEGTRSRNGHINRFHKGAFYVAEKLHLDILPIVLHGTGYTMSKSDFMLKNGMITIKLLPRIKRHDSQYGIGYAARTKGIASYFRSEYKMLAESREQGDYFHEKLKYNFIYKGPQLEWYMRIKTNVEKNYRLFDQLLPKSGRILDIGCGYGFLTYMLSFTSKERQITALDYDADKISVARHCFSKLSGVSFDTADIMEFNMEMYDGIVMSDVLHYLTPESQEIILKRCFSRLNPGGIFILKDGDSELHSRHKGTRLTEFISTRLLGFNKTMPDGLSFTSASKILDIVARQGMDCRRIDDTQYTSNITFVINHKVGTDHAANV